LASLQPRASAEAPKRDRDRVIEHDPELWQMPSHSTPMSPSSATHGSGRSASSKSAWPDDALVTAFCLAYLERRRQREIPRPQSPPTTEVLL
jgi:hypothetical protein